MYDTIAAPVTPPVPGPIGVIRVSGQNAPDICAGLFETPGGLLSAPNRSLRYGRLLDAAGQLLDMALAVVMRAPNSYTGENVVEIHCHGSPVILQECMQALYARGARLAKPGEFTKRAFFNGRMDLTQVEATIDLIESETAPAARNAMGQLCGALSGELSEIYEEIAGLCAHFGAAVDYPEEDIAPPDAAGLSDALGRAAERLDRLLTTFERGRILREGVRCAIVGRPNVGKSSLLNALAGFDRAIVTDIPGTTRDTVEETVRLGDVLLRVSDTAGLRPSDDPVERLGVERARNAAREAQLLFIVLDGSAPLTPDDRAALDLARGVEAIVIVNKSDLPQAVELSALEAAFLHVCCISSVTGAGIAQLDSVVRRIYETGSLPFDGTVLANVRQADAVRRAFVGLKEARRALGAGVTPDVVLGDLEYALDALGEVLGRRISEDILTGIFSRFCVGK